MDKEAVLQSTRQYVMAAMQKNDPAHDSGHIHRVVSLAIQLQRAYPQADPFRTQMLALLHDLCDDKLQANMGSAAVADFLWEQGLPEEDIVFLVEGIGYISYRKFPKLPKNTPIEVQIVQDADRIDAMGAVGIARTFAYGGAHNRSLQSSLAHFDDKLLRLYDLLSTEEGKCLAKPRYDLLKEFYRQMQEEIH